jgi:hypothetical protein
MRAYLISLAILAMALILFVGLVQPPLVLNLGIMAIDPSV